MWDFLGSAKIRNAIVPSSKFLAQGVFVFDILLIFWCVPERCFVYIYDASYFSRQSLTFVLVMMLFTTF